MKTNVIYNEDCNITMVEHIDEKSVDIVLTSPPYCTSVRAGKNSKWTLKTENTKYYPTTRYDVFIDNLDPEEYVEWTIKLFNNFDRILKKNGCVLYNISYSSSNRDMLFTTIAAIIARTNFSMMDMIVWKKNSALPNNTSSNKLTRIIEPVFVFARKDESDTFVCNKKVVSVRERTGQKMYENVFNFIEAANNDGVNDLNKATYSSELCEKLLSLYGSEGMVIYDPFMGTGTTGVACKRLKMDYIGSELSKDQTAFAMNRIAEDDGVPIVKEDGTTVQKKVVKRKKAAKKTVPKDETTASESVSGDNSPFIQDELFDEDNPNDFMKVNCRVTVSMSESETDSNTITYSKPMTALEQDLEDEFSDFDDDAEERAKNDYRAECKTFAASGFSLMSTEEVPVDDDEFE